MAPNERGAVTATLDTPCPALPRGSAAAEDLGAELSNTAPSSSNDSTCGGLDTLEVSIYGTLNEEYQRSTWLKLHREQEKVRGGDAKAGELRHAGRVFMVAATGSGRGQNYLPFRLECEGVTVSIAGPLSEGEQRLAKVELGALLLMTKGHREGWAHAVRILRDLGVVVKTTKVSRVDLCVDLPGVDIEDLVALWFNKHRITRARKGSLYTDGLSHTGFDHGADACRVRVYDKRAEMKSREGTPKFCAMRDLRWGGVVPDKASRVEYQLRRDFLRETLNVDTVDELFGKLAAIARYMVHDWFRLTETKPDTKNKNQSKVADAEAWQRVVAGFAEWTGQVTHRLVKRPAALPDNLALKQQLVGIVESLAAISPDVTRGYDALVKIAEEALRVVSGGRKSGESPNQRIAIKRSKFAAQGVLDYVKTQHEVNQRNAWDLHPADCFCERCRGGKQPSPDDH